MPTKEEIERGAEAIRAYLTERLTNREVPQMTPEHLAELVLTAAQDARPSLVVIDETSDVPPRMWDTAVGFDDNGVPGEGEI